MTLSPGAEGGLAGTVERAVYRGAATHVTVRLPDGQALTAAVANAVPGARAGFPAGTPVMVAFAPDSVRVLAAAVD